MGWEWPFQPAWSMYSADPKGRIFRKKMRNLWISRKPIETCMERDYVPYVFCWKIMFFHTCQVRVVRFYQSCSSPPPPPSSSPPSPPPPLPPLPCSLPPCQLFAKLFANFRTQLRHCWASTARVWAHWAPLDQLGTFRAQWAPLDLNLGPSELSEHRWTSTWDPPSSVSTAGPQRPDRMPEDMPDRTPNRMSERMPEDMPDRMPKCMPEDMPDKVPEDMPDRVPEGMPDRTSDRMPEGMPEGMPDRMSDRMPEGMPDKVPECQIECQKIARRYAR